jgi:hypothetical protein
MASEMEDEDIKELLALRSQMNSTAASERAKTPGTADPLEVPLVVRIVMRVEHGNLNVERQEKRPEKKFMVEFGGKTNIEKTEKILLHEIDAGNFLQKEVLEKIKFPYTIGEFALPKNRLEEIKERNEFLGRARKNTEMRNMVMEKIRRSRQ